MSFSSLLLNLDPPRPTAFCGRLTVCAISWTGSDRSQHQSIVHSMVYLTIVGLGTLWNGDLLGPFSQLKSEFVSDSENCSGVLRRSTHVGQFAHSIPALFAQSAGGFALETEESQLETSGRGEEGRVEKRSSKAFEREFCNLLRWYMGGAKGYSSRINSDILTAFTSLYRV